MKANVIQFASDPAWDVASDAEDAMLRVQDYALLLVNALNQPGDIGDDEVKGLLRIAYHLLDTGRQLVTLNERMYAVAKSRSVR
jgi:hypothetical protein